MRKLCSILLVGVMLWLFFVTVALASPGYSISVQTEKNEYALGETVVLSGQIIDPEGFSVDDGIPVQIEIIKEGVGIVPGSGQSLTYSEGDNWGLFTFEYVPASTGNYTATVSFFGVMAQTSFSVTPPKVIVHFNDVNLEAAVREALGKPAGDITDEDMARLVTLTAENCAIHDLTGLEYATNLKFLNLSNNQINDISVLENLNNLQWLQLSNNQIKTVSPLVTNSRNGGLAQTDIVYLENNFIDLSTGSQTMNDIQILVNGCVTVTYVPQNTISKVSVDIDPTYDHVYKGEEFWVNLKVQEIVNLYGASMKLSFNPEILTVVDGGIVINNTGVFSIPGLIKIDNTAGLVKLNATRTYEQYGYAGFDGNATLFRVKFHAANTGTSELNISDILLFGNTGAEGSPLIELPVEVVNGNVAIEKGNVTGLIFLEAISLNDWRNTPITYDKIEISLVDLTNDTVVASTSSNEYGYFEFPHIVSGSYRLIVYLPGYLKVGQEPIEVADGSPVNIEEILLLTGDLNKNNRVDLDDLIILRAAYDTVIGEESYNFNADLDANGLIDLRDLIYLARNYIKEGYGGLLDSV